MDVRWSVFFSNFVFILPCFFHFTATFKQQGSCYFPERWEGTWFQSGVRHPIVIQGPRLSSKGRCLGAEGDKFLVVDEKRNCYRCVVIHEKHENVLQYKETYCHSKEMLSTLCSLITGDALLYSMFRENAKPVPCPFKGPFTFTYSRGHGECSSPVSSIDTCTDDSRLLLSYQACPDIHGTESAVEELQCLAVWKEGSSRYLVGNVNHSHATSNEDRFRCFVYEKASITSETSDGVDYRVAQSGDATCNGLFSATEGSRTMTLTRAPSLNKCRFPSWLAIYNHWHTLDYSATYSFHHRNSTLRITNSSGPEMKIVCAQLNAQQPYMARDESSVTLVAHFTKECQSGFTCMSFYRRDIHVMEVQTGINTKRQEDACTPAYFNRTNLPYVTLVTSNPEPRHCPYVGKFDIKNLIWTQRNAHALMKHIRQLDSRYYDQNYYSNKYSRSLLYGDRSRMMMRRTKRLNQDIDCDNESFSSLVIGCISRDRMEFISKCSLPDLITSYSCHGRWEENNTHYLITTPVIRGTSHGARRFCFIYKELGPDLVLFSTAADNCDRNLRPGSTGELVFNITNTGKCIETSGSSSIAQSPLITGAAIIIIILNFVIRSTRIER